MYAAGGGARTLLTGAGLLSTGGAGDVGVSAPLEGWDVTFGTDRFAFVAYPELSEFMVSFRVSGGAVDEVVEASRSSGGIELACS